MWFYESEAKISLDESEWPFCDVTGMMEIVWGIIPKWPYDTSYFQVGELYNPARCSSEYIMEIKGYIISRSVTTWMNAWYVMDIWII